MNCGYLIDAQVIDSFKGNHKNKISFWTNEKLDFINNINRYLVFTKSLNLKKLCLESRFKVGGSTHQTMFPFWNEKYILANRRSFLAFGSNGYDYDEFVKAFNIIDHRIHAVADWEKVKVKIKQLLSSLKQ